MLYDLVWAWLRPGIKARIKGENGRFASIDELFKKARDLEIKPNRDRRAQPQPAPTAKKSHVTSGGSKDEKRMNE
jgi:hypothetical protein